MGFTLRAGNLSKKEVRQETNSLAKSRYTGNIFVNGKTVNDRLANREYQKEYYQRKKKKRPLLDTNLVESKESDMVKKAPQKVAFVDNNELSMNTRIKQAAWVKLATLRLAINFILRNRGLTKQAWGFPVARARAARGLPVRRPRARAAVYGSQPTYSQGSMTRSPNGSASAPASIAGGPYSEPAPAPTQVTPPVASKPAPSAPGVTPQAINDFKNIRDTALTAGNVARKGINDYMQQGLNTMNQIATNALNYYPEHRAPAPFEDTKPLTAEDWEDMTDVRDQATLKSMAAPIAEGIYDKATGTYDFKGDYNAAQQERDRIEGLWGQLTPAEQRKYQTAYDNRIKALDSWEQQQHYRDNPEALERDRNSTLNFINSDLAKRTSHNNVERLRRTPHGVTNMLQPPVPQSTRWLPDEDNGDGTTVPNPGNDYSNYVPLTGPDLSGPSEPVLAEAFPDDYQDQVKQEWLRGLRGNDNTPSAESPEAIEALRQQQSSGGYGSMPRPEIDDLRVSDFNAPMPEDNSPAWNPYGPVAQRPGVNYPE